MACRSIQRGKIWSGMWYLQKETQFLSTLVAPHTRGCTKTPSVAFRGEQRGLHKKKQNDDSEIYALLSS